MSYNKAIISGKQIELTIYENDPPKYFGRQNTRVKRDFKTEFTSMQFPDYRDNPLFIAQQVQRRASNARRASLAFRRLVSSNLCSDENPLFISFTFNRAYTDVRKTSKFFHSFTVRMRQLFGGKFRYVAVPEFQKSGRVHYHALFWGLPADIARGERENRTIANIWGQGFVDVVETDNSPKLAGYMAKYMTKTMTDARLWNCKAYFASRNIIRPKVNSGFPLYWLFDEYGLNVLKPEYETEFSTVWLGNAKYQRYNMA